MIDYGGTTSSTVLLDMDTFTISTILWFSLLFAPSNELITVLLPEEKRILVELLSISVIMRPIGSARHFLSGVGGEIY